MKPAERLRLEVLDQIDPFLIFDLVRGEDDSVVDLECTFANQLAREMFDVEDGSLDGRRLLQFVPSAQRNGLLDLFRSVAEGGATTSAEVDIQEVTSPGFYDVWCSRAGDGVAARFHDIAAEIVERRALADSERHFRLLAENSFDVVIEVDRQGKVLWVSPSIESALGWTTDQIIGTNAIDLISDLDRSEALEIQHSDLALQGASSIVLRYRTSAGGLLTMSAHFRPVRDERQETCSYVIGLRDVQMEIEAVQQFEETEVRYRDLVENSVDVVYRASLDGTCEWVSPVVTEMLGSSPSSLVGTNIGDLVHPDDLASIVDEMEGSVSEGRGEWDMRARRTDGSYIWVRARVRLLRGADGQVNGTVGTISSIEAEHQARQELIESEARFRVLIENASDVIFQVNLDTVIEWISPLVRILDEADPSDPTELIGHRLEEFIYPPDRARMEMAAARVVAGEPVTWLGRIDGDDGPGAWVSVTARPIFDDDGRATGAVASIRDVNEQVLAQEALAESEERFRLAMESAPIGLAVVDLDRRFIEVNPALCSIVGRTEEWLLAHRIPDIIDPDDDALDLHMRAEVLSGSQTTVTHEKRLRRADGMTVWVSHSIGLLRDRAGRPSSYISTFADVSEGKAAQERLQYQATHDSLTRLVNRQDLFDRAESILSRAAVTRDRVGVLYVDVDGLKAINDTYGHSVGDVALVTVATRLDMIGRNQDIVSRIGGDEFVVLIPNLRSISDAEAIASRILLSMDEPIEHEGGTFTVTVSIGIALAEPGANTDETLKEADAALYQAKQDGRARWATYDKGIERA